MALFEMNNQTIPLKKIEELKITLEPYLKKYSDNNKYKLVTTLEQLEWVVKKCEQIGYVSIDLETTGLNFMTDEIVGICISYSKFVGFYIPINHKNSFSQRLKEQITLEQIKPYIMRLNKLKTIYFNGKFDMNFLSYHLKEKFNIYWDCYIAAKILNENEPAFGLKPLHKKYCKNEEDEVFKFNDLFKDITFDFVPLDLAVIYGANDPIITFELFEFQHQFINENPKEKFKGISFIFFNVEMPLIPLLVEMEQNGVSYNLKVQKKLYKKYYPQLENVEKETQSFIEENYKDKIRSYIEKNPFTSKIEYPVNLSSPIQLEILLFEILKMKRPKNTKGVSLEVLQSLNTNFTQLLLKHRELSKLINTYIIGIKEFLQKDEKIHCNFNQLGAKTGRFSVRDPALQTIDGNHSDVRNLFKASEGYYLISGDYS